MLRKLTQFCVRYAERNIPDPYLYAVIATFNTGAASLSLLIPHPVRRRPPSVFAPLGRRRDAAERAADSVAATT